jgi:hypothetical protein
MSKHKCIAGALALTLSISSATAATSMAQLDQIQGKVLINQGSGYESAGQLVSLNPGDKVFVGKDSGATLKYASGCSVAVAPASVVTVQDKAPCAEGDTVAAVDSILVTPVRRRGGRPPAYGGGAAYVPIVVSVSVVVTILVSVWIGTHNNGGGPVSAP